MTRSNSSPPSMLYGLQLQWTNMFRVNFKILICKNVRWIYVQFKNACECSAIVECVIQLNDSWIVQSAHYFDFTLHIPSILFARAFHEFRCQFQAGCLLFANIYCAIGSPVDSRNTDLWHFGVSHTEISFNIILYMQMHRFTFPIHFWIYRR